ncbi:MAG: hypothetical protein AAF902_05070 [Chloroflexota bacterium]
MNWVLSVNYFFHLLSTITLLGSLATVVILALPALRKGEITQNQWLTLQKRTIPWANGSLVVLLLTGFYQMTSDPNYGGFMVFDGIWAWAMLFKHVAYAGMVGVTLFLQFSVYPDIDRLSLLTQSKPEIAAAEKDKLLSREQRLLRLNVFCAVLILLFTAIMTAV